MLHLVKASQFASQEGGDPLAAVVDSVASDPSGKGVGGAL